MDRPDETQRAYLDGIVERVGQEDGFVAGYWTHDGERAYNVLVFSSPEAAELRAADVRANAVNQQAAGIVAETITVAEVVAHATAS